MILDTPEQINAYRALVIAKGLETYAATGMKLNRAYTPKNMMKAAEGITGKKYRARDYTIAAMDIRAMLES